MARNHGIVVYPSISTFADKPCFDNWIKCNSWTWKSDFKYYFYYEPLFIIKYLFYHIIHNESREEFDIIAIIGLAQGMASLRTGRMYRWIKP